MNNNSISPASFRDPSGFVFFSDGEIHRQINSTYGDTYRHLMKSGCYQRLVEKGLLVAHRETDVLPPAPESCHTVIKPNQIPFVSYPYEWSFSQLKDAALTTLNIQDVALDYGMTLKDASAYNIMFSGSNPIFIDTLSFDFYEEGTTWVAYLQFCQHFLAPLALMSYKDVRLNKLLRLFIDGVPLDLASELLPLRSKTNLLLFLHIHLHAKSQTKHGDTYSNKKFGGEKSKARKVISLNQMHGLIDSLRKAVQKLQWKPGGTEWGDYYEDTNYTDRAMEHKKELVCKMLKDCAPKTLWDFGANTGVFSRLASEQGIATIAYDIDPSAVEKNYISCREHKTLNLLPLIMDLTNPSPAIGWHNSERQSLADRSKPDALIALALIHHLTISNNVPLPKVANFFATHTDRWLLIEFVPKNDSQVQRLLSSREDIFANYSKEGFEEAFCNFFQIDRQVPVEDSERHLYLMKLK